MSPSLLTCNHAGAELPPEAITSLFEALTYCQLAEDAEVANLLGRALVTLSARYDLALAECGARYPGMYRLMAHPEADVRSMVGTTCLLFQWRCVARALKMTVTLTCASYTHWCTLGIPAHACCCAG